MLRGTYQLGRDCSSAVAPTRDLRDAPSLRQSVSQLAKRSTALFYAESHCDQRYECGRGRTRSTLVYPGP
jgi:hypothetical protein